MSWILYRGLAVGRSKRTYELTSSIVPRGTPFDRLVELEFPPIAFDPERPSCCSTYSGPSGYCVKCQATREMTDTKSIERGGGPALEGKCVVCGGHDLRPCCDIADGAAVRLASSRSIAPKRTHVIERGLYCFRELGALHSGIVHRSPVLLDDRR